MPRQNTGHQRECFACRTAIRVASFVVCIVGFGLSPAAANDGELFYETKVRPLMAMHCQKCHGMKKQEAGLRLDSRTAALKGGDHGPAITLEHPSESLLLRAVSYDGEIQMPPAGKLADEQLEILKHWVRLGAPWPSEAELAGENLAEQQRQHWAFQPVIRPALPVLREPQPGLDPVDQFILAKLQEAGLSPLNQADRKTLIRRVTFDLTGLPPTVEEIQAFLADDSPEAFNRVIERLLASPAYGERWGRHWLDVARYADTAGDGADYPVREAGRYRDWVIRAFNANMPFDQFIRSQVAGDIFARGGPSEQYAEQVTATGFLAIGKRYGYGLNDDYQYLDFADAIDSVGRSVLGLSIGCARCHDHKFDPVTMHDYYGLYGIFQSTQWAFPGGEEFKRPARFPPLVPPDQAAALEQRKAAEVSRLDGELARLKKERSLLDGSAFVGGVDLAFEEQPLDAAPRSPWVTAGPNTVLAAAQSPYVDTHPKGSRGVRVGSGLKTDGVRYVFPNRLPSSAGNAVHFTIDFRTVIPAEAASNESATNAVPGTYRFYLGRGVIESLATQFSISANEFAIGDGQHWQVLRQLEPGTWYTLRVSIDPSAKTCSGVVGTPSDLTTFEQQKLSPNWDGVLDTFICDGFGHLDGATPIHDLDNIGLRETPFGPPGVGSQAVFHPPVDAAERLAKIQQEIASTTMLRDAEAARVPYPVAYGVSEGTPVNARLQKRGDPERLGDEVPRRFLGVLGGDELPDGTSGSGRRELATWLTRPTNPLTARVFVNRVWQWHFGQGLVSTPSDFGLRGERPSHPDLLDCLAAEFVESGWDIKNLHRVIVRSQAYQRTSDSGGTASTADPTNRWLWCYSRQPLDAESIRDAMLLVSGRLDRSVPSAHPFPDVSTWGFTIHAPFHAVYESNHRSVYLMVQRSRPHPFLALFDSADPGQSVAQRLPTTTPTQALFLMNSPFVREQAEAFARRLLDLPGSIDAKIRWAVESTSGRLPSADEIGRLTTFLANYEAEVAHQNLPTDQPALAAWTALARVLLTENAFLYVD